MNLLAGSLVVFAITLTVNKSKVFGGKREFVQKRYEASKVGNQKPSFLHRVWHAWWTCSMCLGFWVSLVIAPSFRSYGYVFDVLIMYGVNWLIHCVEDYLVENSQPPSSPTT